VRVLVHDLVERAETQPINEAEYAQGVSGLTADAKGRDQQPIAKGRKGRGTSSASDTHVANALRSAYEEAVREDVPPEFLDLLGKLA
jgi:hypothetical protein